MLPTIVPSNTTIDRMICQAGTPKGIRATMIIGEVNGMMEAQNASEPSGFLATANKIIIEKINGIMIGIIIC